MAVSRWPTKVRLPVVTAGMDYLFLGNTLAPLGMAGMGGILAGLMLVFSVGNRTA